MHAGTAVAVTNGTHAIEVALQSVGIGEGDEVIVPDYTFVASAGAVLAVNAVPILVDIDPSTLCIAPEAVEAAIGPRTAAVLAVHLAGHPADMDRLRAICIHHGLKLVEDCAHAHGASWNGDPVGSMGDAGTFSFQQSKLMTAGEGGAVVARDPSVATAVRSFSDCGREVGEWFYHHAVVGGNTRMTEWQAAVLLGQMERFDDQNTTRNANAMALATQLSGLRGVSTQGRDERTTSQGYFCFVARIDEEEFGAGREQVRLALRAEGIPLTMSYPPIHTLACFADPAGLAPRVRNRSSVPDYGSISNPETERAAADSIWITHRALLGTPADTDSIVEAFAKVGDNVGELRG
jgi:dTDP-4-amino-4,6-dideoxygalactose transaminase